MRPCLKHKFRGGREGSGINNNWLLFQRTSVWFPAPMWSSSQLPVTPSSGCHRHWHTLQNFLSMYNWFFVFVFVTRFLCQRSTCLFHPTARIKGFTTTPSHCSWTTEVKQSSQTTPGFKFSKLISRVNLPWYQCLEIAEISRSQENKCYVAIFYEQRLGDLSSPNFAHSIKNRYHGLRI